jgi:hypothetical protein
MNDEVLTQLEVIRREGHCNMLNRSCVRDVAEQCRFEELVDFLKDASDSEYATALKEMGRRRA